MNRNNGQATLQIGETRFAIKCDCQPFMDWLHEACTDFLVKGEPHARIDLTLMISNDDLPKSALSVIYGYIDGEDRFTIKWRQDDEPNTTFRTILDMCLHSCIVSKQTSDLWMHASGVIHEGRAYLFSGPSGAGKSTISDILADQPGFTVLHDELVAVSPDGPFFRAWSSPMRGTRPASVRLGAPLDAIFFLKHAEANSCVRMGSGKTVANLLGSVKAVDRNVAKDRPGFLNLLLDLAEFVPAYELNFKPDFSFWHCIEKVLEEKTALNVRKG